MLTSPPTTAAAVPASSPLITHITIKVNKGKVGQNPGPFLDRKKVDKLPDEFGPGPINRVVRESVQRLVDASYDQKEVFGLLRQGDGKVIITASFEDKLQTVRLPKMEQPDQVWDFMEILFEELRCELFYEPGKVTKERKATSMHSSPTRTVAEQPTTVVGPSADAPPTLTPATQQRFSSTTDSLFKRKLVEQESRAAAAAAAAEAAKEPVPSKNPRLDPSFSKKILQPFKQQLIKKEPQPVQQAQQQPRPRGRPLGSKNTYNKKDSAKKSPAHLPGMRPLVSQAGSSPIAPAAAVGGDGSNNKKVPIYHNAHKIFQHQQQQLGVIPVVTTNNAASLISTAPVAPFITPLAPTQAAPAGAAAAAATAAAILPTVTYAASGQPAAAAAAVPISVAAAPVAAPMSNKTLADQHQLHVQQQQLIHQQQVIHKQLPPHSNPTTQSSIEQLASPFHISKLPADPNEWNTDQVRSTTPPFVHSYTWDVFKCQQNCFCDSNCADDVLFF